MQDHSKFLEQGFVTQVISDSASQINSRGFRPAAALHQNILRYPMLGLRRKKRNKQL